MCDKRMELLVMALVVGSMMPSAPTAAGADGKGVKVFRVDDYGADPAGVKDSGPAVRKALAAAIASTGPKRVVFSAGTYRMRAEGGRRVCLPIARATDLTVEGVKGKTELIVTDPSKGVFGVRVCRNFTLKGLTIDYDPPPFTQGVIRAADKQAGTFDLEVDEGFPLLSEPWFAAAPNRWGMIFEPKRRRLKTCGVDHIFMAGWTPIGDRTFRMKAGPRRRRRVGPIEVGDRWVQLARTVGAGTMIAWSCDGLMIEDLTVYASPSCAAAIVGCTAPVARRLSVRYRPGTKRLLTTNADGVHCQQNRTGPVIESCHFEGMADDSINVYCPPNVVLEVVSPTELVVAMGGRIRPGDRLQVLDPRKGIVKGVVTAEAVRRERRRYRLTLADPFEGIVAGADHSKADTLYNLDASGAGYVIRNNTMRFHRRHGMLLRAGDGLVEGNRIEAVSGLGIVVTNEPNWPEGPMARNVVIRNNTIIGCGYTGYGDGVEGGLIQIRGSKLGYGLADGHGLRDITIADNTIADAPRCGIYVGSAEGVKITGNTITADKAARAVETGAGVVLERCGKVVIEGLTVTDPRPGTRAAVRILPDVDKGDAGVTVKGLKARLGDEAVEVLDERGGG
ncbi:MAG: right-handed parallel beta-helix repeat-containing protein [Planctomycetota bacterium]|jgi:hypothetical protein